MSVTTFFGPNGRRVNFIHKLRTFFDTSSPEGQDLYENCLCLAANFPEYSFLVDDIDEIGRYVTSDLLKDFAFRLSKHVFTKSLLLKIQPPDYWALFCDPVEMPFSDSDLSKELYITPTIPDGIKIHPDKINIVKQKYLSEEFYRESFATLWGKTILLKCMDDFLTREEKLTILNFSCDQILQYFSHEDIVGNFPITAIARDLFNFCRGDFGMMDKYFSKLLNIIGNEKIYREKMLIVEIFNEYIIKSEERLCIPAKAYIDMCKTVIYPKSDMNASDESFFLFMERVSFMPALIMSGRINATLKKYQDLDKLEYKPKRFTWNVEDKLNIYFLMDYYSHSELKAILSPENFKKYWHICKDANDIDFEKEGIDPQDFAGEHRHVIYGFRQFIRIPKVFDTTIVSDIFDTLFHFSISDSDLQQNILTEHAKYFGKNFQVLYRCDRFFNFFIGNLYHKFSRDDIEIMLSYMKLGEVLDDKKMMLLMIHPSFPFSVVLKFNYTFRNLPPCLYDYYLQEESKKREILN